MTQTYTRDGYTVCFATRTAGENHESAWSRAMAYVQGRRHEREGLHLRRDIYLGVPP